MDGVGLVGRSGARNRKEFEKLFRKELSSFAEHCDGSFPEHYSVLETLVIGGTPHRSDACSKCKRDPILRVQALKQALGADKYPTKSKAGFDIVYPPEQTVTCEYTPEDRSVVRR